MPLSIVVFATASASRWLSRARSKLTATANMPSAGRRVTFKPGADRYRALYCTCTVMDYSVTALGFILGERYNSGAKYNAFTATMIMWACLSARYTGEFLKASWFADILPASKVKHLESLRSQATLLCSADGILTLGHFLKSVLSGEGLWKEFSDRTAERRSLLHTLFYIIKIFGVFIPIVTWFQCRMGDLYNASVMEMIPVYGETAVPRLVLVHIEFLAMSVIKDALSMGVLHRLMHHPKLYKWMHKTHHVPLKETTIVSATYFDIADLVIENAIAPTIMTALYGLVGFPPRVHACANFLLGCMDFQIHSIAPYTVCFHNPILDHLFNCNVSHQLHHALHTDHFTVWPWHQLGFSLHETRSNNDAIRRSVDTDMALYNNVFATHFPCA